MPGPCALQVHFQMGAPADLLKLIPHAVLRRVDLILYARRRSTARAFCATITVICARIPFSVSSRRYIMVSVQDDRGQRFHVVAQAGDFGCQRLQYAPDIGQITPFGVRVHAPVGWRISDAPDLVALFAHRPQAAAQRSKVKPTLASP